MPTPVPGNLSAKSSTKNESKSEGPSHGHILCPKELTTLEAHKPSVVKEGGELPHDAKAAVEDVTPQARPILNGTPAPAVQSPRRVETSPVEKDASHDNAACAAELKHVAKPN